MNTDGREVMDVQNEDTIPNSTISVLDNVTDGHLANPLITQTQAELWIMFVVFYTVLCGIITNIASVMICVGLYRKKEMRTRFFVIIGCLTFCRTLLSTQFLIIGIYRTLRTAGIASTVQRRLTCHVIQFWLIHGVVLEQTLLCTLVIDRIVAIMAIGYYRLLKAKSAFYICVSQFVIVTLFYLGPCYFIDDMFAVAPCIDMNSFLNPYFSLYRQYSSLAVVLIILILYVLLVLYLKVRAKMMAADLSKNEVAKVAFQRQLKLMPIFRDVVILHCSFSLTSRFFLFLSNVVPIEQSQRMMAWGNTLICVDLFANVIGILFNNSEIRAAAIPWWRSNRVDSQGSQTNRASKSIAANPQTTDGCKSKKTSADF